MVQRNLKKLLFLMVLLLGVGQAAQAKRMYADLEQIEATEKGTTWTVESESGTFAWTNDGSYITLFASETGFADYNCLCFSHGEMTQHIDIYLVVNEEEIRLSPTDGYWSKNQDRVIDIRDYYDGDLADANEIRMYGYGDNGSVVLSDICLAKKLEFNDEGVAEVALSDFEATGGVSINLVDNTVSCNGTEGTLVLNVVDEDFSNVASVITSWDTNENSGYTDLFGYNRGRGCSIDGKGGNVHEWTGNPYNITTVESILDGDAGKAERSKHVISITFRTQLTGNTIVAGKMKFNSMVITKNLISVTKGGEVSLQGLPYLENKGSAILPFEQKEFVEGSATWNMSGDADGLFYGVRWNVQDQQHYVDLNDYDELRVYMANDGVQVRCWFISNQFNFTDKGDGTYDFDGGNIITKYLPSNDSGKDYATINLADIKEECGGKAYLIGVLLANSNERTRLNGITVYKEGAIADYVLSGKGELNAETEIALADPNATVIDATGITKATTLNSANPNCLFIANKGILSNENNVLIADENGGYTCKKLVLDVTKPFRIPGTIHATAASAEKNVTDAEYATMVLPFEVNVPENVTAYKLTSVEGDKIMGEALTTIPAGQPVLLEAAATDYTFEATEEATLTADQQPVGNGLLKGVYVDSYAPASSYVLQNQDGNVAFYKVQNADEQKVKQYTAYLLPGSVQQANRLIFALGEDDVTGVEGVEATAAAATVVEIYDLSGRRVNTPVKGINLMKMSDGTVKKVIVK